MEIKKGEKVIYEENEEVIECVEYEHNDDVYDFSAEITIYFESGKFYYHEGYDRIYGKINKHNYKEVLNKYAIDYFETQKE